MIIARWFGNGNNFPINRIVIHSTCPDVGFPQASKAGAASGTAKYFASTSVKASAHYVCDISTTIQCVPDKFVAYHAPPNTHAIGIEICSDGGYTYNFRNPKHAYTREQWLSPQVWPAVERAAILTRDLCNKYGVPKRLILSGDLRKGRSGICSHESVSGAWHQTDHSDPGPNFPWNEFMAVVNGKDPKVKDSKPEPKPIIIEEEPLDERDTEMMKGAVYKKRDGNYVYLLFNDVSGFYSEFGYGSKGKKMPGNYVNPIAENWDTNSWPTISESHANEIKRSLDKVRKGS